MQPNARGTSQLFPQSMQCSCTWSEVVYQIKLATSSKKSLESGDVVWLSKEVLMQARSDLEAPLQGSSHASTI
jgi:hypothetical protein